jgi:lipoate-protein ligase A
MNSARLILDQPAPGAWNMAVDEALLHSACRARAITLRLYGWSEATLSLGYFQPYDERRDHPSSVHCPAVRRATGGGAIVHDHEITYSLTAPSHDRLDRQLSRWYDLVHQTWIVALGRSGVECHACPQTDPQKERQFLCFERRCAGDLLCGSTKVGGSAQRRHVGAVLQHGSLLLRQSAAAPELAGLADLTGLDLTDRGWLEEWANVLAQALNVFWQPADLTDEEQDEATTLVEGKFGQDVWTLRR